MKTLLRILVLGSVFVAATAQAQPASPMAATDIAQIKADVRAVVAGYVAAFNRKDPKAIADSILTTPSVAMGANGIAIHTQEQAVTRYVDMIASFEKTGWAKSEISDSIVCVLNANVAFADTYLTRFKADGSVLSRAATIYVLNKSKDGKWGIATFTGHDLSKKVTCAD